MIATSAVRLRRSSWRLYAPASALLLWGCLWLNLNTSFWNIQAPHSLDEWQLLGRAVLPFAVLPVAGFLVLNRRRLGLPGFSPSRLLMIYGVLAAIAAVVSPKPTWSLYWSMTFLATIAAAWTFVGTRNPVASARQCLQVTWALTFVVCVIIAYMARGAIFGGAATGYYDVITELKGQSRAEGVGRWAAVPGLVCVIKAYYTRRPALIAVYLAAAGGAFFIVYRVQSRGAVFGAVAALLFALFASTRLRRYALPCILFAALAIPLVKPPAELSDRVMEYLERGAGKEQLLSMTGRTTLYENGVAAFREAPILGRGQWAGRLVGVGHVHNSYLEALLNAGILGGIPYVASWIAGWVLFFRLQKRQRLLRPEDRTALLEAGTVMMFFTVRSIPETTTASFAVDLLVMAAVYVYLETLTVSMARRPLAQSARMPARANTQRIWRSLQVASRSRLSAGAPRD